MKSWLTLFLLQCRSIARGRQALILSLLFYLTVVIIVPFTLPAQSILLQQIAPGIIWLAVLFALLFALPRLFAHDHDSGMLDQWLLSDIDLAQLLQIRLLAYWLFVVLPLIVLSSLVAVLFNLSAVAIGILLLGLLLGTPIVLCFAALASVMQLPARHSLLLPLLLFPLCIPVFIFATSAVMLAQQGVSFAAPLYLLAAIVLALLLLTPWCLAKALRLLIW